MHAELLALLDASDEMDNYSPFSTKAAALLYLMANSRHPIVCVITPSMHSCISKLFLFREEPTCSLLLFQ